MDKLEKYILENKSTWEEHTAPEGLWPRIEKNLTPSSGAKSSGINAYILVFAGLCLGLIGAWAYSSWIQQASDAYDEEDVQPEYAYWKDFQETDRYYITTINKSMEQLSDVQIDATLMEDLSQLDRMDQHLRSEYHQAQDAYKERILHALILNHQTKLGVLQRVLFQHQNNVEHEIF